MTFSDFLLSGHTFEEGETLLKYQYRVLNTILLVIIFFASLFAFGSLSGLNPLGSVHTSVNLAYAASASALMLYMRGPKRRYRTAAYLVYAVSLVDFISALIYVPHDEFRIIWFYLVVFAAYITGGVRAGNFIAALSVGLILALNALMELQLSSTAIISSAVGLVIASILFRSYTSKILDFESELTEQKQRLQSFNDALEARVEAKTAELQELNTALEARVEKKVATIAEQERLMIAQSRLAAMGEMMSMIAHQWRQPLSTTTLMITNARLKNMMAGKEPGDCDEILDRISDTMLYLSDTIDDFQTYFKPEKSVATVRVSELFEHVRQFTEPRLHMCAVELTIEQCDEVTLQTYTSEITQVLINLFNNAIDAMLEHRKEGRRIVLRAMDRGEEVAISVEDNGGGIAEKVKERIFEPYFSTKSKNGTGLGLYMAKMIIEKHIGGVIRAENRDGGAHFSILLPKRPKEEA